MNNRRLFFPGKIHYYMLLTSIHIIAQAKHKQKQGDKAKKRS